MDGAPFVPGQLGLSFRDLTFAYPRSTVMGGVGAGVFESFNWSAPPGATVILGPNGAGKTTLLSLAATALRPTAGTVRLDGWDTTRRRDVAAIRRAVGWMPQHVRAIPGLTAREQVAYAGWLKGMRRSDAWREAAGALAMVGLTGEEDRRMSQLSGGQQRRVGLAQLLVHQAQMLLLDEPTAGLDPGQRARFRETVRSLRSSTPLVVSTHQVDDLTDLFDTVVVLDSGRIRFQGDVRAFLALAPAGSTHPAEAAYATSVGGER
ncbi:MAG: ATP-binding cassette domain-containing protein [Chloroflexota bacterium]